MHIGEHGFTLVAQTVSLRTQADNFSDGTLVAKGTA
jgi:hypothetical protein